VKPGVTLNPATPAESLEEILPYVDLVLVMSVNPGFGGQSYIPTSTDRIARIRRMLDERGLDQVELQVDGGVAADTVGAVVGAGATCFVAGSAVYNDRASVAENIRRLREAVDAAGGQGRP
jgi:ribulose-phosphate 3-epimerase